MNRKPLHLGICLLASLILFAVCASGQSGAKTQQAIDLFNQGQDAHEKGDLKAALELYDKALEVIPEFPEVELQRGNALVALKKPDEAEKAFRRALEIREDWTLAMANLGSLLVDRGKYEEAEKLLEASIAADESNATALVALADLRLKTNADEAALRATLGRLNTLARKARPTAQLFVAKATVELKLKDLTTARQSVERAMELEPKLISAKVVAAGVALQQNDFDLAETYIKQIEAVDPKSESTLSLKARLLYGRGKRNEALAILESIASPTESVKSMIVEIKDHETVDLAGLEAKIQRTPNDANVLAKLCQGFRVSNPLKAIEYCRRASIAEPNEISHAVGFGAALVQAKQYDQAVGLLRKLLTIAPEHATIRANLATALFQLKRYPEAKIEFRWLTEKQPQSPAAYYFLAIIHDQLGEYLDALANYQQFLKFANPEKDKLEIEKVTLRLPAVQKQLKNGKGRKTE